MIKKFEGCEKKGPGGTFSAYPDPASGGDPWTIGYGTTGADVKKGLVWTQKQCDDRFAKDLPNFGAKVAALLGTSKTTQNQYDAMVSFAYNLGVNALRDSTLLKKHKAGDYANVPAEFNKWVHGGGKVMPGLVTRRAAEAKLYATP
ncbi:MAG TPA: lysozyme [Allosphingosinicella sp.]|jgi:GH24 family phage-related lysozyme (muramidase)